MDAYQQTISRHASRPLAAGGSSASTYLSNTSSLTNGMTLDEASKILNVDTAAPKELVEKVSIFA